ncbi:YfhO family protein [uncultured Trichococcus sp.]|uniref:YfhO family protein n=1 Tax=uncultured Trichococcus sp. TaxID=189665 RepID=UPI002A187D2B|nr:YfhO family protein [uncultured Trichococcus sp.]
MLKRFTTLSPQKNMLFLSFLLPLFVLMVIYATMGVYPFGNNTLLTVDLGQQYVDFFSYYRTTLLSDPSAVFFSFTKSFGGEMLGLWAYYLMSPFNLIFLLFPQSQLPLAVTLLILVKVSASGLTFAHLLISRFGGKGLLVPAFALSYALMGYVIVNQLNVMWLDGLVFLPLIILGLEKLLSGESGLSYSFFLGVMLISNYYIGFMICVFLVFYSIFAYSRQEVAGPIGLKTHLRHFFIQSARFIGYSLLGAGFGSVLLIPTFYSLLGSKASYANSLIDWSFAYDPFEVVSKFYIGAFNFDQMPSGHPNLFIGTVALTAYIYYFVHPAFSKKERFTSFALTVLFFLAMNVQFLNKIWHAGQYPIWYPYRFSFTVCFFFLLNGFRALRSYRPFPFALACCLLIANAATAIYVLKKDFEFLEPVQVLITAIISVLVLVLLMLRDQPRKWLTYALLFVVTAEMTANAAIDLFRLGYVKQDEFADYQTNLNTMLADVRTPADTFYRIEKTFQRSKNDSFQANYAGINHFSSTFEKEIPALFGSLGFPDGNGFIVYSTGTLFTDALFGVKYFIQDKKLPETFYDLTDGVYRLNRNSTRPDLTQYNLFSETDRSSTYENPYVLSLAFGVSDSVLDLEPIEDQPILMQEQLLDAFNNQESIVPYFSLRPFDSNVFQNVTSAAKDAQNTTYYRSVDGAISRIEFQFTPASDNPYYLILDAGIDDDNATLYVNNVKLDYYTTYRNDQVINIASNQQGENITFTIELLEDSIRVQDLKLYELNKALFEETISGRQAEGMTIDSFSQTHITGSVTIAAEDEVLLMTIPYSEGWKATIDGETAETTTALNGLLAVPISPGKHTIALTYRTPYLMTGLSITGASITGGLLLKKYRKKK